MNTEMCWNVLILLCVENPNDLDLTTKECEREAWTISGLLKEHFD